MGWTSCADYLGLKGIALSGYGTDQDARASKEAGFAHHLIKPSDLGGLVDLIRRWRRDARHAAA